MAKYIYSTLCWIWLVSTAFMLTRGIEMCPKLCDCNKKTNSVSCCKLMYIPRLPSYVKNAKFFNNNFAIIDKNFFRNLTGYNNIKKLTMTNNVMKYIDSDAFIEFRDLISLEISREPNLNIGSLKKSFQGLNNSKIQHLSLSFNEWKNLPADLFMELKTDRKLSLYFIGNQLRDLRGELFAKLKVTTLNVLHNVIKNVYMDGLYTLEALNLGGNYISDLPSWSKGNVCLVPNLQKLELSRNAITEINYDSFRCLPKLKYLRLDFNNIRILKNNTFGALDRLESLFISNNARLEIIEDIAFNASLLKQLQFGYNNFHFNRLVGWNSATLFSYCPNLKTLVLSSNYLPSNSKLILRMLKPLLSLEKLVLADTRIRNVPFNLFPKLKYLNNLNLQGNFIKGWNRGDKAFGNNSSLKVLDLGGNNIRLVNKTTFPDTLLKSLDEFDLSYNPFACTCNQKWFRDWIRKTVESNDAKYNISLKGYPKNYVCMFPSEMKGVLLQQYNPTTDSCKDKNPYVIIASSTASVVISIIIIIIVLHQCQTNIRNHIYLWRLYRYKKSGYIRIDSDEDYEYHAFIVYCDTDREWVHNICLKKLEEDEGMKVCIHQRDFDIGEPVTGNIEKYMSKCHKIVVIMSNNFAKSEWCQWEVDLVLERRRKQGRDVSILVMLKSIDSRHMTNSLKALLQSTSHLKYCTGVGEKTFWKALTEGLRKPFGHPPIAML